MDRNVYIMLSAIGGNGVLLFNIDELSEKRCKTVLVVFKGTINQDAVFKLLSGIKLHA